MLTINRKNIREQKAEFEKAGIHVGNIDIDAIVQNTTRAPVWAHYGAGNLFKAHHAMLAQRLIEDGQMTCGIVALVPNDFANIDTLYTRNDNLFARVVMKKDGTLDTRIISAVSAFLPANPADAAAWEKARAVFAKPSLQMLTITITEKGYNLKTLDGAYTTEAAAEFDAGPRGTTLTLAMTKIAALLYERYTAGAAPLALISTDNFSHNGDRLKEALVTVAREWEKRGATPPEFTGYLAGGKKISYPLSMIDKITPYASESVQKKLETAGLGGMEIVRSGRGSVTALFVNTEEAEYLVIEDAFPNGRPPLEKAGVYLTSRETVDMVERMKVCTCLNPLHTALAIYGCLLGYTSISAEMGDNDLATLVHRIAYDEGMPVVSDPGIIQPAQFVKEVLEVRLPNPNIPDTPQRIATDTSQKLAIRFGQTIKAYRANPALDTAKLRLIPLVIAAWCRYLLGIDDTGDPFTPSPDPLLEKLQNDLAGIQPGKPESGKGRLRPILANEKIFENNLYQDTLGERIENYFEQMLSGPGAVRQTLQRVLQRT